MALSSLKRQWSRAFSLRDLAAHATSGCDTSDLTDEAHAHEQLQSHRRSSPKASVYQQSPPHSGTTLHDPDHAPTHVPAEASIVTCPSDTMVHVMTVGDSVITVETHRKDAEKIEKAAAKLKKKSFSLRRVKTAPPTIHDGTVSHGSVTTIESVHTGSRLRAWSYPQVNWKKLNLVRRVRRNIRRKEARKGKAPSEPGSDHQSQTDVVDGCTCFSSPRMSGAVQNPSLHTGRPSEGIDISPRTSAYLGVESFTSGQSRASPKMSLTDPGRSSGEQDKRKDSHFHDAIKMKEKATTDMEAVARQLRSDERPHGSSSFLLHPIDWLRNHHTPIFNLPSSNSSSSSGSLAPSPTTCPARRTQETHLAQTRTLHGRRSEASTREEMYTESRIHLPPGLEIPAIGHAGPSDWLNRGWEEHYRRSAESCHRACHPLTAARYLPTRGEEMQRYNPRSRGQEGSQHVPAQKPQSAVPNPQGLFIQDRDFAFDSKGKGIGEARYAEDVDAEDVLERRDTRQEACVTTVTLRECEFEKNQT